MQPHVVAVPASTTRSTFAQTVLEHPELSQFLVRDGDRIVGVVGRDAAVGTRGDPRSSEPLGQIASERFVVVSKDTKLGDLLNQMYARDVSTSLVVGNSSDKAPALADVQGVIGEHETAMAMIRLVDLFCN